MRISDWSSDVCSSDLVPGPAPKAEGWLADDTSFALAPFLLTLLAAVAGGFILNAMPCVFPILSLKALSLARSGESEGAARREAIAYSAGVIVTCLALGAVRSEEHTSELQSLMRISYAVFCFKKKN